MKQEIIVGINVPDRENLAVDVQKVISEFGCSIRARIGLHEVQEKTCSPHGLIILHMIATDKDCTTLLSKLRKVKGVKAKKMIL
ncbi:MAG: hypothetical protein ACLFPQ_05320 [Candidatus Woesearchaeota archaeon]